tara:strand:+ start:71 stop:703 length:633 start_codon:yes stop_codon:yes gene_type:complete
MKKIFLIFSILFFSTNLVADEIENFEIEGFTIGESLLKHFSKKDIETEVNSIWSYKYKDNKYIQLGVADKKDYSLKKKTNLFDSMSIVIKGDDKNYIIKSLSGKILCHNNINRCNLKYGEIVTDLKIYFENSIDEVTDRKQTHSVDKKKESWVTSTYFYLKNRKYANIMVEIYDWSKRVEKEQNWGDNLKLSIQTDEFIEFLQKEAYDKL